MLKKLREMMNVKIRLLRGLLEEAINNIDAGNSNHTEEVGFKELSWSPKDFDEATMNKVRKYSSRKGL